MSSDFSISWELSRGRFGTEVMDLTLEQLNFRLYPGFLTIGEMALHVAGVEIWFISQLNRLQIPADLVKVAKCATEGVVNADPFPFSSSEITPGLVTNVLEKASALVREVIFEPTDDQLTVEIQSALGPIITGRGALARLAFHPAYHHGQAYQLRNAPGFPK